MVGLVKTFLDTRENQGADFVVNIMEFLQLCCPQQVYPTDPGNFIDIKIHSFYIKLINK